MKSSNVKRITQSFRIFEELEFSEDFVDYLQHPLFFQKLEEYLGFTGPHITKLTIKEEVNVNQKILQKLLNLLPNLKTLEVYYTENKREETIKLDLKSTKIETVDFRGSAIIDSLLESLEKCTIKELQYYPDEDSSESLQKFLGAQEKNLKTLKISSNSNLNLLIALKDLRLEHFEFSDKECKNILLDFLKQQVDLKSMRLSFETISIDFDTIFELKNLEDLDLVCYTNIQRSGLNNIRKLQKLKRLKVSREVSRNILNHLQFGVFNDLEELDAWFDETDEEFTQEMKKITPNLRKIIIHSDSTVTVEALLKNLEDLEYLELVTKRLL
jgi:hypothetical protein